MRRLSVVFFCVAALVALACNGDNQPIGSGSRQDAVQKMTISVTFTPHTRKDPVKITYTVAGGQKSDSTKKSPWNHLVNYIGTGAVFLSAFQAEDGNLDCLIAIDGRTVGHQHRTTPGHVDCHYSG